ncbi:acetylserotonin O-methyltransferase [Cesiribacter sp. SM1]|uniref:acetylserotonin O-methyltransferase n=1 Tax=Cesiribacter sp. SM1 TaxID=2861196 RepID=UPI001CD69E25|nr:acetylserotonin O-methyltransferase [Cesiribacter sp. SM1]
MEFLIEQSTKIENERSTAPDSREVENFVTPAKILETGMAFWASKTLLTAIKLELFTLLGEGTLSGAEIGTKLNLHPRSLYDFLDALVALGFLERKGIKEDAVYCNTLETSLFLNKTYPSYVGGILEMANDRLYPFWGNLEEGLKTGKPQNEAKTTDRPIFEAIYAQPQSLELFLNGMAGAQACNFVALANRFDFAPYNSLCDIGGANGLLSVSVARQHPHLHCISADLPPVAPVAERFIQQSGLSQQIRTASLNFFEDNFPAADIITMGNILHDWGTDVKKMLIRKAWEALPKGGALIVIENIIDNDRRHNAFGLMMSLNMLIETEAGYDFSMHDFDVLAREAGFSSTLLLPLAGPASAAIAYK